MKEIMKRLQLDRWIAVDALTAKERPTPWRK